VNFGDRSSKFQASRLTFGDRYSNVQALKSMLQVLKVKLGDRLLNVEGSEVHVSSFEENSTDLSKVLPN
jgi:hypothetical protein